MGQRKFKVITPRRLQAAALLLIAAAGLRQATMASSSAPDSFPLVSVVRDFNAGQADFANGVGDNLPASFNNIAASLGGDGLPVFKGGGSVLLTPARDSSGRSVAPQSVKAVPVTEFTISGATISSNQPMVARMTVIGAAIASGNTPVPVTTRLKVGNTYYEPFGAFSSATTGNVNDNRNPRNIVLPTAPATPGSVFSVDGQSWLPSGNKFNSYMTVNSSAGGVQVKALRNGDSAPNTAGFDGQVSAKAMLSPYINTTTKKVTLAANQVIYLFELGSTDTRNAAFDMQDLVVLVELASDPSYFSSPAPAPAAPATCGSLAGTPATSGAASSGGIASADSFATWFKDVPGRNVSQPLFLTMVKGANGVYTYTAADFHPIDGEMYGNQNASHNRGFTLAIDASASYKKCSGQYIEYVGDGDAWLFVNGKLAMDVGGTHPGASQIVDLDRLDLTDGSNVSVKFFYAQRTSNNAAFTLRTNTPLTTNNTVGTPSVSGIQD